MDRVRAQADAGNVAPGTGSGDSTWSEAQTKGRL